MLVGHQKGSTISELVLSPRRDGTRFGRPSGFVVVALPRPGREIISCPSFQPFDPYCRLSYYDNRQLSEQNGADAGDDPRSRAIMKSRTDLLQGSLDLLILKTLALEPLHGWAVSKRMRTAT